MTEEALREKVCAQARAWLGKNEADGSHKEIIDIYNAGRPSGTYKMSYADPWCAAFVSAVGMACGLGAILLPHVNCDGMIAAYRAAGRWIEDDGFLPAPGNLIFYDWDDDGVGDNIGSSDHVGLVAEVSGDLIRVIEGNKSDAVAWREIRRDARCIRGYAVPDYGGESVQPETPPAAPQPALVSGLPELSRGSKGIPVVALQGVLIARGYSCGPDGADGDLGYNTWNAICRFQRDKKIIVDGVVGAETWTALLLQS